MIFVQDKRDGCNLREITRDYYVVSIGLFDPTYDWSDRFDLSR